jgi:hypothetical protein
MADQNSGVVYPSGPRLLAGDIDGDDQAEDHCPGRNLVIELLAGAKCTVNVTFKPTAYGARAGSLTIADDASGSPQNVGLSGTGLDYSLSSSPSSVTVNSGSSALYTINVKGLGGTFSSTVSLSCSGLPAASTCSFSHVSVVPGATSANSTMTVATTKRHGNSGTPPERTRSRSRGLLEAHNIRPL